MSIYCVRLYPLQKFSLRKFYHEVFAPALLVRRYIPMLAQGRISKAGFTPGFDILQLAFHVLIPPVALTSAIRVQT